jgi:hypothetical protein
MSMQRPRHPSGRPFRDRRIKELGFTRRPFDEPLTPGLQRRRQTFAVGFTADLGDRRDAEDQSISRRSTGEP